MTKTLDPDYLATSGHLRPAIDRILEVQTPDGAIAWFEAGPWDPWNHVECLMALDAANETAAASDALNYLMETQEPCGSWMADYGNGVPMQNDGLHMSREQASRIRDTNFTAYCAVGVWRRVLHLGDLSCGRQAWPMVKAAIDHVVEQQSPSGDISWCPDAVGGPHDDALVAGNASIFKSLTCAIELAAALDEDLTGWKQARDRLGNALRHKPERFDRNSTDRSDFAMDWYYPVLAGVLDHEAASQRLDSEWRRHVKDGLGCLCVASQPWVTVAETAELALALTTVGKRSEARELLVQLEAFRPGNGPYWMGHQFEMDIVWPEEAPTWTQAAVVLAWDALTNPAPCAQLLVNNHFQDTR